MLPLFDIPFLLASDMDYGCSEAGVLGGISLKASAAISDIQSYFFLVVEIDNNMTLLISSGADRRTNILSLEECTVHIAIICETILTGYLAF